MSANPFPKPSDEDFALARRQSGWTDCRTAVLKWLWAEGLSCSQIAKRLTGITRNAVIGKAHRLKLVGHEGRPTASAPRSVATPVALTLKAPRENRGFGIPLKAPAVKPSTGTPGSAASKASRAVHKQIAIAGNGMTFETAAPAPMPKLRCVQATGVPARIIDPGFRGCKWPLDDPGRGRMDEALFCCGRRVAGRPYCAGHVALASGGLPKPSRAVKQPSVGPARGPGGHRYAFGGGVQ